MSYIGSIPRPLKPARSAWRWFPLAVAGAMAVVIIVNVGMVYAALSTFPGAAGANEFELSNRYDAVLAHVEREAALGWTVAAQSDAAARPIVTVADKNGLPMRGAAIAGTAERPVGAVAQQQLVFRETAPGRYAADVALLQPGQWDLQLTVSVQGQDMALTRRIHVR